MGPSVRIKATYERLRVPKLGEEMATQKEQWHKVVEEEAPVLIIDTGDSLGLLRAVRDKYYARAQRTLDRATDDETGQLVDPAWAEVIEDIRVSGDRVNALISQGYSNAEADRTVSNQDAPSESTEGVIVQDQQGTPSVGGQADEGSLGDDLHNAVGLGDLGAGQEHHAEPVTDLPGPSSDQVDSGSSTS